MFELKINDVVSNFATPGEAVVCFFEAFDLDVADFGPVFLAVASLDSGKSFYDNDTGAVITNLY